MKFGVVIFPGSNCDEDMIYVLKDIMEQDVVRLWHKDTDLQKVDGIVLPGGGFVFGVCNGFQILCETGLLQGALLHNTNQKFICKNVHIKADNFSSSITSLVNPDKALKIPIAHGEGRYYADAETLKNMRLNKQILYRYCDEKAQINNDSNPNGSVENIAGICNEKKNVYGMMPHPERASDDELGNTDGRIIFESIISSL